MLRQPTKPTIEQEFTPDEITFIKPPENFKISMLRRYPKKYMKAQLTDLYLKKNSKAIPL